MSDVVGNIKFSWDITQSYTSVFVYLVNFPFVFEGQLLVLIVLMALSLLYTYLCYVPIATFQKAGTCLNAQQSMAKQPIKGCVSNHNRTCGKSVSEKSE